MIENKKVITWSLITLFLSLSMVYSLTYMKKATLFKNIENKWNETLIQTWTEANDQWTIESNTVNLSNSWNTSTSNNVSLGSKSSWVSNSNTQTLNTTDNSVHLTTNTKTLSGTNEYYGVLDIVGILWVKPEFTLQDSKWNYFAYYWDNLNFVPTVLALWGNVYEMVTEAEILQNQLFGDKVSYINLSMFKDVWVLMVVEIDGEVRLLQIPANQYHQSKDYLRSLFIQ